MVMLLARADRRLPNRLPTPTCPQCGTEEPLTAIIRTTRFVYFRCHQCRELLPKVIPPLELAYGLVARVGN